MNNVSQASRAAAGLWVLCVILAVAICAGPLMLWRSPLRSYFLKLDDFVYLAQGRSVPSLSRYLLEPHNGHVVPLFRLETHILARLASSLEAVPRVFAWASYGTLLAAMALTGHIVAWETGKAAWGLAAMAAVGFSTVLGPAILWYAASQALGAGVVILGMLALLQAWRSRASPWLLVSGTFAAAIAPLFWTAGYTTGLVGVAYLWSDGRRACRLAAPLPIAGSAFTGFFVWWVASPTLAATTELAERSSQALANPSMICTHITQAICEALVINNLGLEAATSASQSVVLVGILVGAWVWSRRESSSMPRRPHWRLNPLEAAGATMIFTNFGLIFAARGLKMTYDNLRWLGWYDAIPQLGAVLLVFGWWTGHSDSPPPRRIARPERRELVGVALFTAILFLIQAPRANRIIFQYDGASAAVFLGAVPTGPRTSAELAERAHRQRAALAALDEAGRTAREAGADRAQLRHAWRSFDIPGMPDNFSAADLLLVTEPKLGRPIDDKPRSATSRSVHE
jgi:hypothetical protein